MTAPDDRITLHIGETRARLAKRIHPLLETTSEHLFTTHPAWVADLPGACPGGGSGLTDPRDNHIEQETREPVTRGVDLSDEPSRSVEWIYPPFRFTGGDRDPEPSHDIPKPAPYYTGAKPGLAEPMERARTALGPLILEAELMMQTRDPYTFNVGQKILNTTKAIDACLREIERRAR